VTQSSLGRFRFLPLTICRAVIWVMIRPTLGEDFMGARLFSDGVEHGPSPVLPKPHQSEGASSRIVVIFQIP
jgi:hypothetical protein